MGRTRRDSGRIMLEAEEKLRVDKNPLERSLNAGLEPASLSGATVEGEERLNIGAHHRPSEAAPRQCADDLTRARLFAIGGCRPACEDAAATRSLTGTVGAVRPVDGHASDARAFRTGSPIGELGNRCAVLPQRR